MCFKSPSLTDLTFRLIVPHPNRFLRWTAIFAILSAITTFFLWLLPRFYSVGPDFQAQTLLYQNPFYMGRLWVNFIHIFFAIAAYAGAAYVLKRHSPALASFGFLSFLLWGFVELLGVSILLIAVNYNWRANYAAADPDTQAMLESHIHGFSGIWDAMFFLLLIAFLIGTIFFGMAAVRQRGMERMIGCLFLLAAPLTIIITLDRYAGMSLSNWIAWSYPILQPASRFLLGLWLWHSVTTSTPKTETFAETT